MITWILGLSGAGKTTIGRKVYDIVKEKAKNTVFLDSDVLRDVWQIETGHTIEDL